MHIQRSWHRRLRVKLWFFWAVGLPTGGGSDNYSLQSFNLSFAAFSHGKMYNTCTFGFRIAGQSYLVSFYTHKVNYLSRANTIILHIIIGTPLAKMVIFRIDKFYAGNLFTSPYLIWSRVIFLHFIRTAICARWPTDCSSCYPNTCPPTFSSPHSWRFELPL